MTRTELLVSVPVAAPAATVWHVVTDWPGQRDWIMSTRVAVQGPGDGRRLGARFNAFTGIGPVGITDPMEVVEWDPPRRCVVTHLGRVVRGDGVFEVVEVGPARSECRWTERLELPLGALGRVGWALVRPAFRSGVEFSLRRLARLCEARFRAGSTGERTADG